MKTCFFIGHRDSPDEIYPELRAEVARHIEEYNIADFVVGHYGHFDMLAAKAVIEEKKRHPEVSLALLLPYHPAERKIQLPKGFDCLFYPPGMETVPRKFAIVRANRYMIEHSTHLIAYAWHPASNARNLVDYATKRGIVVTKLHRV